MSQPPAAHSLIPRLVRTFAVPVVLFWFGLVVVLSVAVPPLEQVSQEHTVSLAPEDAPSMQAMKRVGKDFQEFDSNSSAMILLESDQPLGAEAHHYYDGLIQKLKEDPKHVEHVQDFWGDPLTAAGSQSADGKAAYVQVYLAGNQGESLANESVDAVQKIVAANPPRRAQGLRHRADGLSHDQHNVGDSAVKIVEMVTIAVIFIMLVLVYRSVVTTVLVLVMVFLELTAARGVIAFLGNAEVIGLSTFAVNLLATLSIAAATDYAIFLIGRYHEARQAGEDRETAYYTMYHGTAHVILGSGLTIAGATLCLHFARLPYFMSLGFPLAIGMLVVVFAALTFGPAVIAIGSRFRNTFEPKRKMNTHLWRRVGTAVVRWPAPILVASIALALVGLLALPSYTTNYNDRNYLPRTSRPTWATPPPTGTSRRRG